MENKRPAPHPFAFPDYMRRSERTAALIYLPIHVFALPFLLPYLAALFPGLDNISLNAVYYGVGFVYVLGFCTPFLRKGFDITLDAPGAFLYSVLGAWVMEYFLSALLTLALSAFNVGLSSPNNDAVVEMIAYDRNRLIGITVFLAPLVEEILFRGLLFGALAGRRRRLAWVVSVAAFSLYHVWQYAIADPAALLSAVFYIPGSIALTWCYERTGSIWSPIAYHMLSNFIAVMLS